VKPTSFPNAPRFRAWLAEHHATVPELLIRLFKSHAQAKGLTYRQALDESLCFGWIDGVRRSEGADTFLQRFTPRRAKSFWSRVNIKRYRELLTLGRVRPSGRAAFAARDPKAKGRYSFESKPRALAPAYARKFRAHAKAWAFHQSRPPWYRRVTSFWVMNAKKPETRAKRLDELIACSAKGAPIRGLHRDQPAPPPLRAKR
jgi:uncharacterized protein YdeI (YjbR/CyaY-like superfamily)